MTLTAPSQTPKCLCRPWLPYVVAAVVMFVGWTLAHHLDQPYRSATYRRSFVQCLAWSAWTVPTEGAGPLMPLALRAIAPPPDHTGFGWKAPLFGGFVYLVLVALMSWIGRRWSPLAHGCIGIGWFLVGAYCLTVLTMKRLDISGY